ncbi:MAG: phenylacetic acid degradation operon negative regulatory protein [Methylobacteriaceae bacterium]|nr:phenylacetic acid degradation operon negative regulatory protein [Methylobacteriaceae bacterium]
MRDSVEDLLNQFHARTPIRAGSLIVTLFGDAIVPRGGHLALASLLEIMRAFRVSETLVRTAMSRLVAEGLFERKKIGRNTFYSLSSSGRQAFSEAAQKIYGASCQEWDGRFDLVLLEGSGMERADGRAQWQQSGYGVLTPDVLLGLGNPGVGSGLHLSAEAGAPQTARRLAARAWPLEDIATRYDQFNAMFEPIWEALAGRGVPDDLGCLVIRILLIHQYRRIVLRDPLLPAPLLPQGWPGRAAHDLCAQIYAAVADPTDHWLSGHAVEERGPLPPPAPAMSGRFASQPR